MNARFIYQSHKWLAVTVAAATLAWFISGAVMVLPGGWRTLSPGLAITSDADPRLSGSPEFEDARIPVSSAIATVRARTSAENRITGVKLRRLPGRLAYELATGGTVYLVDAISGDVFGLDDRVAAQMASAAVGADVQLGPVTVLRTPTSDYFGKLPAYRVPVADGKGTVVFISGPPVEMRYSDRLSRTLTPIVGWHELSFLRPALSNAGVRLTMLVLAVTGTLMSIAGTCILFLQFQRWRRPRSGT
jgi:hypothetical protein